MKRNFKKTAACVSALAMAANLTSVSPFINAENEEVLFWSECEDAQLTDDLQVTDNIYTVVKEGYSGDGFVWMQNSGTITFEVDVPETGMYSFSTRYIQELSEEGRLMYLVINGKTVASPMLPYTTTWSDYDFGFFKMEEGVNTVEIKSGYGFAYFDTFTVDFAELPALDVESVLCDSQATPETQSLMNYLTSVYGKNIISGQQEIYGGGNDGDPYLEFDWIENLTGELPAIKGFDFMNYNPLYGWDDQTTERAIEWAKENNGIVTGCWHINIPVDFENYELGDTVDWKEATYKPEGSFNTANAVVEGTKEYEYLMLAIEDLAEQLARLQDEGVPIILRPFHEAEGNGGALGEGAWFWWGAGGAEVYKQLWKLLYTELTETYGLHNIIWEYNSYTYETSPQWYPGDDYVDIVGFDKYNTVYNRTDGLSGVPNEDAISSTFYKLVELTDGKKMVSMPENDTIPNIENLTIEKAGWLYFCPWYGEHLMSESFNYQDTLIEIYKSDYTITLDELPENLYSGFGVDTSTTTTPVETDTTTTVSTSETSGSTETDVTSDTSDTSADTSDTDVQEEILAGDTNGDGKVTSVDLVLMKQYVIEVVDESKINFANSDMNSDGKITSIDLIQLKNLLLS